MHTDAAPTDRRPRRALHWLCCALVLMVGMTRQLVICTHADGPPHLEFAHFEGSSNHDGHHGQHGHHAGCCHGHAATAAQGSDEEAASAARRGEPAPCEDSDDPHGSCDDVQLCVELGPQPLADHVDGDGGGQGPLWTPPSLAAWWERAAAPILAPRGTGPPRPRLRPYLAHRASIVLLI